MQPVESRHVFSVVWKHGFVLPQITLPGVIMRNHSIADKLGFIELDLIGYGSDFIGCDQA